MKVLSTAGERSLAKVQVLPLFFLAAVLSRGAPYQFSADVEMVVLQATVRDQKGGFPLSLRQEDLQVYEDGKPQAIRLFKHQDMPVSVGLVVDNSGSMRPRRGDVATAARAFVRRSNPEDEMFVINFNDRVLMGLPVTKFFSADSSELEQALSNASTGGKTALYDAVTAGIERLRTGTGNKVLIVISDGGDNASRHTLAEVLQQAERSDVIIYTVGLFEDYDMDQNPRMLKRLARQTGGQAFFPKKISDVLSVCERIAADIRSQYTIGYVPTNRALDGTYRAIKVTAKAPGHGTLIVRTRAGYLASPNQGLGPAAPPKEIK